jgi:NADP-reducing hydrogenase subunit HndB
MGFCYAEPTVEIRVPGKEPIVFGHVDAAKAVEIVDKYIVKGELIDGILPVSFQTIEEHENK